MTVGNSAFEGADGPLGMFPTEMPWTPEAGFIVDRPPAQIDDALTRALTRTSASKPRDPRPADG